MYFIGKVKLSVNITSPNPAVFQYCSNLKEVVLSENMQFLGDFMFSYCTQLTNIVLPDTLTSVLRSAFQNCDNLKNITVPKNVTTIRDYAFGYYYDEQSAIYKNMMILRYQAMLEVRHRNMPRQMESDLLSLTKKRLQTESR